MIEEIIRNIIREEIQNAVQEFKSEVSAAINTHGYPPVITVKEAAKIMNIGLTRMYELTYDPSFPAIRDGKKIRIITSRFFDWLSKQSLDTN